MAQISIEEIISNFKNDYGVKLSKLERKKIFFTGRCKGKSVVVAMPSSKVYERGNGWVDLTEIQIDIFKQYSISIIVFRLLNSITYYVNMSDLFPLLTQESIHENAKEGKHWKLDVWPDKISVRKSESSLSVKENEQSHIGLLFV